MTFEPELQRDEEVSHITGRRGIQGGGKASAKALSRVCACHISRSLLIELQEQGEKTIRNEIRDNKSMGPSPCLSIPVGS